MPGSPRYRPWAATGLLSRERAHRRPDLSCCRLSASSFMFGTSPTAGGGLHVIAPTTWVRLSRRPAGGGVDYTFDALAELTAAAAGPDRSGGT